MKTIKKLQYMMLATIVAMATHELSASSASSSAKPAPITAPKNLEKIANTRKVEIASREGYNSRGLSAAYDSIFGQPGARDSLTNQKTSAKDAVDSLSLTPETQIKAENKTLDLTNTTPQKADTTGRGSLRHWDTTSNYLRNSVSKDVKVTKRITNQNKNTSPYKDFVTAGDKIVERWDAKKENLLDVKIESADGSYRIVDNSNQRGGSQGKIISVRTADGKTIENAYYGDGIIKQSIVKTPRTLNMLESNSMQTRAVTNYSPQGTPTKTVTYKESIGGNSTGKIISVKMYEPTNPLEYTTYNSETLDPKNIIEKRVKIFEQNGLALYAIQIPSKPGSTTFANKQLITIDTNSGKVKTIQTFNDSQNSKSDQSSETIDFSDVNGNATKTIFNKAGRPSKVVMTDGDNLEVIRVQESLNWDGSVKGRTASSVTFDKNGKKLPKETVNFGTNEFSPDSFKAQIKSTQEATKQAKIAAQKKIIEDAQNELNALNKTEASISDTASTISSNSDITLSSENGGE